MTAIEDYSVARPDGFLRVIDPKRAPAVTITCRFGCGGRHCILRRDADRSAAERRDNAGEWCRRCRGLMVGQLGKLHGCRVIGIAADPSSAHGSRSVTVSMPPSITRAVRGRVDRRDRYVRTRGHRYRVRNVGGVVLDAALMNLKCTREWCCAA